MGRASLPLVILLALGLCGCGPKTIASILNPTRYHATTVVDFRDRGQAARQVVVSGCKVIDQSDSIAANTNTTITGERHWVRRADGSLWVLGLLDPCRWGVDGAPAPGFLPVTTDPLILGRESPEWRLSETLTYRFDNAEAPTRLETYSTRALFEGGVDGLSARGQISSGGETITDSLREAFPWLVRAAARDRARGELTRAQKREGVPQPLREAGFEGFTAQAVQLRGGAVCWSPDPNATAPVILDDDDKCRFLNECHPGRKPTIPCQESLGGLRPTYDKNFSVVRFSAAAPERDYVGTYVPTKMLGAAKAPADWSSYGYTWRPEICLDGVCGKTERMGWLTFYYPARNVLVAVRSGSHHPHPGLFLAEPGPRWGGSE